MATEVDIKQLLEAGAHFGHKTSRWHPKMAPYIHSKRNGSHVIDLTKTVEGFDKALAAIEEAVASGRQILFVGTKRQAQEIVKQTAIETGMPYVTERWLGGLLTNKTTMAGRIKHLKDLETKMESGELASRYVKLEVQRYQEEIDKMNRNFGGVKDMVGSPAIVFIVDVPTEQIAVKEAHIVGAKVVALVDTNADPTSIDYVIPCNDDAIKTIQLALDYIKQAIEAGKGKSKSSPDKDEVKPAKAAAKPETKEEAKAEKPATEEK